MATRTRRLEKTIDYAKGIVDVKVLSIGKSLVCNVAELPEEILQKLVPLAISHRIGDAAAGRDGDEALDSMTKVWEGLKAGNFTIRKAAKKGITKEDLSERMAALSGKDATVAAEIMKKLGIEL